MPSEAELGVKLVPDETALDNIQDRELGVSTGGDGGQGQELDEERNEKLQVLTRGFGRIAGRLGKLAVIAAAIAGLSKLLGEIFDIGFEDVRQGIVDAIDTLIDPIKQAIGIGGGFERQTRQQQAMAPGPLGFVSAIAPGLLDLDSSGEASSTSNAGNNKITASLFTSRDSLTGDSTQQEMQTQNFDYFTIEGGS